MRAKLSKRTLAAAIGILVLIPACIAFGITALGDRKYNFISLSIILITMIPFFLVFEARKPKARELVVIAALCAIAVAGRAAFFMIPQFKPVVAIVIITGVTLGPEAGFLVGAVTGFVSNFFFGQGPWTPWQMFCFGIIGFLFGLLVQKGILPRQRWVLCFFGGAATVLIYGGIINISSVVGFSRAFSWKALLAAYLSGLPFDLIHGVSTSVFLFFFGNPMIEKIERIQVKYGLLETDEEGDGLLAQKSE